MCVAPIDGCVSPNDVIVACCCGAMHAAHQVRGPLPKPSPPNGGLGHSDGPGRWFTPEEAKAANVEAESARHRGKVRVHGDGGGGGKAGERVVMR